MTRFAMNVKDTFRLGDHMLAFIGPVQSESNFIGACDCEIVVGNEVKGSIRIDGEMIPKREQTARGEATSYRSISTSQEVELEALGIGRSGFIIRSKT